MTISPIHNTIRTMLAERGQDANVTTEDSLFISGRLDSLAATEVIVALESEYGIDLADADFDISQLDTIADLEELVGQAA